MSFGALPVFLAFLINRISVRYFSSCRCLLGFTPFSASLTFGFSLITLLLKHPELYPCWLRRVNCRIMFLYELFASLIFIEVGFCLWNSIETFLFFRVPSILEERCSAVGEWYIQIVESEVGISVISNTLALMLLSFTLHATRVCNFNLLFRHHPDIRKPKRNCFSSSSVLCPDIIGDIPSPRQHDCNPCRPYVARNTRFPKTLRSGKKFY